MTDLRNYDGIGGGQLEPGSAPPVISVPTPALTLTGPLTFTAGSAAGTLIANIGNVPAGVTPSLSPTDGRAVVAGNATSGWKVLTGIAPSSAGKFTLSVTAIGATGASAEVSVTAAAAAYPSGALGSWSAASISGVPDGAGLPAWTDPVSGTTLSQSVTARQPIYKAVALGGKPGVLFSGAQTLPGVPNAALETVTNTGSYTLVVVASTIDWTNQIDLAAPVTSYGGNGELRPVMGGKGASYYDTINAVDNIDKNAPLHVAGWQFTAGTVTEQKNFFDGTAYAGGQGPAPFTGDICIGGYSNQASIGFFRGVIHRVMFYPGLLTQVQMLQIQKAACDEFQQPYPWTGRSSFLASLGDSLTHGLAASSAAASYPNQLAKLLNRKMGSYTGMGFSGYAYDGLEIEAQRHFDGISAVTGIPTALMFMEWYNEANPANGASTGDIHPRSNTFLQARRAADPTYKLAFATSTASNSSSIQASLPGRAAFDSYYDTAANRTGIAVYVPVHTDAHIGVDGSAPASGGNTYFNADSVHLTDAGYGVLAGLFASALTAAGLA